MRRSPPGAIANEDGSAVVEFALVLPLLISLFMGIFEVTRVVSADMRLTVAAQSLADMMAQQANITVAESANFCGGARMTMHPLPGASLKVAAVSVVKGSTSTTVGWSDVACGNATAVANATTLAPTLTPNVNDSVIIVQATYSYTSPISYVLSGSYTLVATTYARPRNVAMVTHD